MRYIAEVYFNAEVHVYEILCMYIYIYVYTHTCIYVYICKTPRENAQRIESVPRGVLPVQDGLRRERPSPMEYGQFSKFNVCFCGLDSGNVKLETVRTHRQHICF